MTQIEQQQEQFPKAAPGNGLVLYRKGPRRNSLRVGCAKRSVKVGRGYGVSFGGFAEVKDVLALPVGGIIFMEDEVLREGGEEVTGLSTVIPEDVIKDRMVYLTAFMVHTADSNRVHSCLDFGCPITEAEELGVSALPPSNETMGSQEFFILEWPEGKPEEAVLNVPEPFYHQHEMQVFFALAKLAARGRLEYVEE